MNYLQELKNKLKSQDYKGWDVFDGLNSTLFKNSLLFKSRLFRLAWIQFFKRCPVNFRKVVGIPKGYNAKGLALFIQGLINLYHINKDKKYIDQAYNLADIIISQKAKDRDYFCVGYNFFWEARAFSVPAFTPNIIVSSFVGQAFLDLFNLNKNNKWLRYSEEISKFIEKELILYNSEDELCYGYIPGINVKVHNANLIGALLFARLYFITKNNKFRNYAIKSVQYSINRQHKNGSWFYGEKKHHQWIDNFHTGFNLVAINDIQKFLNINIWNKNIDKGLSYHLENHFMDDMMPKYFNSKLYPIDIHNFAQGIITFITFDHKEKAEMLYNKAIELMWDKKRHYFYYQKNKFFTNKINYIRWSQAWMLYALSKYFQIQYNS